MQANGARPVPLRYYFATKRDLAPLLKDEDAGPGAPNGLLGLRGEGVVVKIVCHSTATTTTIKTNR